MKNNLSVEVDENGKYHLSTGFPRDCYERFRSHPEDVDKELARMIEDFVTAFWEACNPLSMQLIRCIIMAGSEACAEPYREVEEMWSTLMFCFIPQVRN